MTRPFVKIRCESGTGRDGRVLRLVGRKFTFGRDPRSSIPLESDLASRRHVQVQLEGGGWLVKDLGSSNGTRLNGQKVLSAPLGPGDVVELGPDGPRFSVIEVGDGDASGDEADDLEATRLAVPSQAARLELEEAADETPATPPRYRARRAPARDETPAAARRGFPWLPLLGLGLGVATALAAWPEPFPYGDVCAPVLRGIELLGREWPAWTARKAGWLVVVGLGFYGWIAGGILRRPVRRFGLLVVVAGLHVGAVVA